MQMKTIIKEPTIFYLMKSPVCKMKFNKLLVFSVYIHFNSVSLFMKTEKANKDLIGQESTE